jgi:hypothetical protein
MYMLFQVSREPKKYFFLHSVIVKPVFVEKMPQIVFILKSICVRRILYFGGLRLRAIPRSSAHGHDANARRQCAFCSRLIAHGMEPLECNANVEKVRSDSPKGIHGCCGPLSMDEPPRDLRRSNRRKRKAAA